MRHTSLFVFAFLATMLLSMICRGQTTLIMNANRQTVIRPSDPNGTYGGLDELPVDAGDQMLVQYWLPFTQLPDDSFVFSVHAIFYLQDYVDSPRPMASRMLLIWDSAVTWSETGSGGGGWNTTPGIQWGERAVPIAPYRGLTYDIDNNPTPPPVAQMWMDITAIWREWENGQPNRGIVVDVSQGDMVVYGTGTPYRSELWVSYAMPGDANFDGVFNQLDIVQVLQEGKYNTGQYATWRQGDWDRDGVFGPLDIVLALQQTGDYAYQTSSNPAVTAFGEEWE